MKQKISVISVVHNEEKLIKRCLDSVKNIADEILIMHDGLCKDNTIKICKEYTNKIFMNKINVGLPGPLIPEMIRRAKGPWILKVDADEFLSPELEKNIRKLIQNPKADAYTFRWLLWDGKKHITKNWPTKMALYRKSKVSSFGFPHWDDPTVNGNIIKSNYKLEHRPKRSPIPSLKEILSRGLKKYGRLHAEYTLKPFEEFDSFQYPRKDFPLYFRFRRKFPLISAVPLTFAAFFKTLFVGGAWKEGYPAFNEAAQSFLYYPYVGYLVHKLKKKKIRPIYTTFNNLK